MPQPVAVTLTAGLHTSGYPVGGHDFADGMSVLTIARSVSICRWRSTRTRTCSSRVMRAVTSELFQARRCGYRPDDSENP